MQEPTPLQTNLYQFVTAFNSALVMQERICKRSSLSFALKIDNKLGYLFLDVISNVDFKYRREHLESGSGRVTMTQGARDLRIVGNPHSIIYTMDMTGSFINMVRSHRIDVDHAILEVNEIIEAYDKLENGPETLYYYNNLGLPSPRDVLFKNIAFSMLAGKIENYPHISELSMGANSFIIPRLDRNGEVDGLILEVNNLTNDRCSNVCLKYISKHNPTNDIMFMRNAGDRIDMAPLNHNSIVLDEDYYPIINTGLNKGTILTEVYRDITEAKDD